MTEDEMAGWHHRPNGHESEQTPGDSIGWGSQACCSLWGCKEWDMTEQLTHTELSLKISFLVYLYSLPRKSPIRFHGFKCHLYTERPQTYISSSHHSTEIQTSISVYLTSVLGYWIGTSTDTKLNFFLKFSLPPGSSLSINGISILAVQDIKPCNYT